MRAMQLLALPCYCASLRQVARAITVLYEEALADSGLHATQYTALQVLESAPNLTTTDLAEAIGIDRTTATRTLALIKKAGLAADAVGEDRRQRRWSLTARGGSSCASSGPGGRLRSRLSRSASAGRRLRR